MKNNEFPKGWDSAHVERILNQYEPRLNDQAFKTTRKNVMEVPAELVPFVRKLIADFESEVIPVQTRTSGAMTI